MEGSSYVGLCSFIERSKKQVFTCIKDIICNSIRGWSVRNGFLTTGRTEGGIVEIGSSSNSYFCYECFLSSCFFVQ